MLGHNWDQSRARPLLAAALLAPVCGFVALGDATAAAKKAASSKAATRTEHDLLGEKQIPADAYYGVQALRGMENFQLSGIAINHYPGYVEAWAVVKLAAARANTAVGAM